MPGLVDGPAAEALQVDARARDRLAVAGEDRPERRGEALVQAQRDRVDGRGELGERDSERNRGVREPGPVEVRPRRASRERGGLAAHR